MLSRIFEILNFLKFEIFQHFFFYFSTNPPKFQNVQKTGIYVLGESRKNVCAKFQVIPFINAVFIALWMWKMATSQGIGRYTMHFHFSILFRFLCNKRCSKVIFRVLDEKQTNKRLYIITCHDRINGILSYLIHVLRRQMTEIGNLTSWPQMTLTSEKVTSG